LNEGKVDLLYAISVAITNKIKGLRDSAERRLNNKLIQKVLANPRSIVVTRLQNVGDMVAFIPSLIKLRELYPEAEILLLGKHRAGIETIKGAPFIDGILEVGKGSLGDKLRLFRLLRNKGIDLFIISSQDQGRVPWALFSGAKVIVAFDKVTRYNGEVKEKLRPLISLRVEYNAELSDAENNLRLIEALGCNISNVITRFDWIGREEQQSIDMQLRRLWSGNNEPLVVFSPGTKRPSRAWPSGNFREVAVKLKRKLGAKIVLVGTEKESAINELIRAGDQFIVNLAGKTSIHGLGYLLSNADLVVSVDSGPMHIAAAVGVPVVAMFGPGDYKTWKPYSSSPHMIAILRHPCECSPCLHYECPRERHECMEGITVEMVLSEAERLLKMTGKISAAN